MLKNSQAYFMTIKVFKSQDFYGVFGHFSTLYMKELTFFAIRSHVGFLAIAEVLGKG